MLVTWLLQILISLNGIDNLHARLLSKIEYVTHFLILNGSWLSRTGVLYIFIWFAICIFPLIVFFFLYHSLCSYVLSNRQKLLWDINLLHAVIIVPWENAVSEPHKMVCISWNSYGKIDCLLYAYPPSPHPPKKKIRRKEKTTRTQKNMACQTNTNTATWLWS